MLLDSMNMPRDVELAHRRLADFIWTMDEIPRYDDVTFLVELTRCELKDWARILGGLEQKGWHIDSKGHLIHDKILSTLLEAKELYDKKVNQTKAATEARKQRNVERNVNVTENATCHQSESESESYVQNSSVCTGEVELPIGFPKSREEAGLCSAFIGCPVEFAYKVWEKAMSRNGRDSKNVPIGQWRFFLSSAWTVEREVRAKDDQVNDKSHRKGSRVIPNYANGF